MREIQHHPADDSAVTHRTAPGSRPLTLAIAAGILGASLTLAIGPSLEAAPAPADAPAPNPVGASEELLPHPAPAAVSASDREKVRVAVSNGLDWLRRNQDPATGGWINDVGYKRGSSYVVTAHEKPHVGVTSLALMAFLSGGHLPGRGPYGDVVSRGTDYILANIHPESGFITGDGTRMYSHAFATLFLAEIYGMTHREDVKEKLQQAVDLTVDSQNALGSWRYQPYSARADMSITVCQIMALRAARNVGLRVPKATIERAYDYVDRSANKNPRRGNFGGFRYKLENRGGRTTFPLTAAGIATLNHAGIYDNALVKAGLSYLRRTMRSFNGRHRGHYFYWYGHYYASQAFFLSATADEESWEWYWPLISEDLLGFQGNDGSWPCSVGPGPAFSTAVACVILQIPNQYLPIFHR